MGRDSIVGIATRYELDGPGIESLWGQYFLHAPVHIGPGAHPASYIMGTSSFLRVKLLGRGVDHPHLSRAEVKGRVRLLYMYSPSGPSLPVVGCNLPVPIWEVLNKSCNFIVINRLMAN